MVLKVQLAPHAVLLECRGQAFAPDFVVWLRGLKDSGPPRCELFPDLLEHACLREGVLRHLRSSYLPLTALF